MPLVELFACLPEAGTHERQPLPLEPGGPAFTVRLRCLPGASGLHLALAIEGEIRRRVEVEVGGGEIVELAIELDGSGELHVTSPSWHVLTLPPDERFAPLPAFQPPSLEKGLDLVLVVDGTLRSFEIAGEKAAPAPLSKLLLGVAPERDRLVEQIVSFIDALGVRDLRATVLAFGDEPLADAGAADLASTYHLHPAHPDDRVLRPTTPDDLLDSLTRLPPTPGADLVDALADALAVCSELRWRPAARKLVLIIGDSPGHALLEPAPWGCDARAREHDVDVEAQRLHRRGIEIATLYCPPPSRGVYDYFEPPLRAIFDHTRKQYQRLASLADHAFELPSFNPQTAAARLAAATGWIARGPAYGELLASTTAESAPRPKATRKETAAPLTPPKPRAKRGKVPTLEPEPPEPAPTPEKAALPPPEPAPEPASEPELEPAAAEKSNEIPWGK